MIDAPQNAIVAGRLNPGHGSLDIGKAVHRPCNFIRACGLILGLATDDKANRASKFTMPYAAAASDHMYNRTTEAKAVMTNNSLLDDDQLMARETDLEGLRHAYALLMTNDAQAVPELEKLVSAGSVMSALYLADYYRRETNFDIEKAKKWHKVAYERGSAKAMHRLAVEYCRSGNYSSAEELYNEGISRNDSSSMYYMTQLYVKTKRYDAASPEVKNLLERAAAQGHARAIHDLWLLYVKGAFGIWNIPKGFFLLAYFLALGVKLSISRQPGAYGDADRRLWR